MTKQISVKLLEDIAAYLSERPFREVVVLLNRLQQEVQKQPTVNNNPEIDNVDKASS